VTHGATLIDDPELEIKLDRRGELKTSKDEFDDLDKDIKQGLKEKPEVIIGKWKIQGKWVEKKSFTMPSSKYWDCRIKEL
jgi:hypothetical protein